MNSTSLIRDKVRGVWGTEQYEVDEEPELEATAELEIQAKVDTNHPDAGVEGLTLAAEERLAAREAEIQRTHEQSRATRAQESQWIAGRRSDDRRREFAERAASVDPWAGPDRADPREQLDREKLAVVNQESRRLNERLEGWSRAAISRWLAERVVDGVGLMTAVVGVFVELQTAPGTVIPIEKVGDVDRGEVCIEGTVERLWKPSHPAISQVGLLTDETDRIRFTVWKASNQPAVGEGDRVQFQGASKSWYQGRVSVALTGWSHVVFPEHERAWTE